MTQECLEHNNAVHGTKNVEVAKTTSFTFLLRSFSHTSSIMWRSARKKRRKISSVDELFLFKHPSQNN